MPIFMVSIKKYLPKLIYIQGLGAKFYYFLDVPCFYYPTFVSLTYEKTLNTFPTCQYLLNLDFSYEAK